MSKKARHLRQQKQIAPNLEPQQMSQKETLQTAESLVVMQQLAQEIVTSQTLAEEINQQSQFIQQMIRALQGK